MRGHGLAKGHGSSQFCAKVLETKEKHGPFLLGVSFSGLPSDPLQIVELLSGLRGNLRS